MKNIFRIFWADVKGLCTNFFALVIAIALCFLPALYAWFNIYANWDPYANTGNIKIAVCSLDEGWKSNDGDVINMGDSIQEELKEKDSINWVFENSEKETIDGVRSGKYYAAVVIDKDFTYSMYNAIAENLTNPKITYYENEKKNAVATKITDTAVGTLQESINKQYVKAVTENIFETTNGMSEEIKEKSSVDEFIEKLHLVSDNLDGYSEMLDTFVRGNQNLAKGTSKAAKDMESGQASVNEANNELKRAENDLASTRQSFSEFDKDVNKSLTEIRASIDRMEKIVDESELEEKLEPVYQDLYEIGQEAYTLSQELDYLKEKLEPFYQDQLEKEQAGEDGHSTSYETIIADFESASTQAKSIYESTKDIDPKKAAEDTVDALKKQIEAYGKSVEQIDSLYSNTISPQVKNMLESMEATLESMQALLDNLSKTMATMNTIFLNVGDTLDSMNVSMEELKKVIDKTNDKIKDALERIEKANEEDQLEIIVELLSGDPQAYSDFFSQPVTVNENYIYEIMNYGSGVAPFYTTLALWVGMTILVSMIKVHANKSDAINPKPYQLFIGRYLLFFVLSQMQALVIVLGDLYLLKIQCLHPFAFWFVASVASFAFSMLIYSLTISFGDIGKALAVVVMVVQIAGSGGTYPIDALPDFFRAVYVFFPFPYAIDAMRECIGGMYENTYSICIIQLVCFILAGLFIGLVIRIPFIKINHYIEKRMEDTEIL